MASRHRHLPPIIITRVPFIHRSPFLHARRTHLEVFYVRWNNLENECDEINRLTGSDRSSPHCLDIDAGFRMYLMRRGENINRRRSNVVAEWFMLGLEISRAKPACIVHAVRNDECKALHPAYSDWQCCRRYSRVIAALVSTFWRPSVPSSSSWGHWRRFHNALGRWH